MFREDHGSNDLDAASGLLWVSELIEEHSKLAKVMGVRTIYVRNVVQRCRPNFMPNLILDRV